MSIDEIGMYKTDEILEFMTEGEGRGFLGRSMFDTMYFEIERLNNIINELEKLELYEFTPDYDYDENLVEGYTPFNIREYIQELKGSDSNE